MGSSSKKYKEKESNGKKRRRRSESEERDAPREKRHRHKKHHKDKKREKNTLKSSEYESGDSDCIEVTPDDERVVTPPPPKINKSPESQGQSNESLSIEETNKLRAKLGLKPLEQKKDERSDGKRKDDLGEFYHKPATNLAQKAQQEKIKNKLTDHKERRKFESKLAKVKTLGESDSDDDIESWVSKNRRLEQQKRDAEKRAKMLEELDAQFGIGEIVESERIEKRKQKYSDKHLRGLQVEHDLDSFQEGKTVVLTLKDQQILTDDADVLVNVNLIDDERYKKNTEIRKKKNLYDAYEEEFDEFGNLKEKSLLSKYDEEIDGEKRDGFKIGSESSQREQRRQLQAVREKLADKKIVSLAERGLKLASEYYNEEELAKFKKPKKKVRKMRSKGKFSLTDEQEAASNMGIEDIGTRRPKVKHDSDVLDVDDVPEVKITTDTNVEEKDDDLQQALHKIRKLKQKENLMSDLISVDKIKPEIMEQNVDNGSNIVLNATAEFCRTLGDIPTYGKSGNRDEIEDLLDFEKEIKEEEPPEEIDVEEGGRWNSVDPTKVEQALVIVPEVPILDEEPDVGKGMAAALQLAMSKGYLEKEQNNRPSNSRLAHLQAKHYSIEDKSYGDEGERSGRRERYAGPIQDFKEKDTFKPNVKLEYIDDEGHVLNSKEAFRYLSHKFHGKGPGKNKVEKRIKKNVQEGLMKKMSSTDTPLGTLNMLQAKQKEMQSPYIVLSGSKHTHSSTIISKNRR